MQSQSGTYNNVYVTQLFVCASITEVFELPIHKMSISLHEPSNLLTLWISDVSMLGRAFLFTRNTFRFFKPCSVCGNGTFMLLNLTSNSSSVCILLISLGISLQGPES